MNKGTVLRISLLLVLTLTASCFLSACYMTGVQGSVQNAAENAAEEDKEGDEVSEVYSYTEYPLERNNVKLHLDCVEKEGDKAGKSILLVHGVTYSSHEFDIDYKDYSLVRALADEGYSVWRLDIAGFGRSGEVEDGFMPDSDYAAEDIAAAVDEIVKITGHEKIDLLGWSWGTVTAGRYAYDHSERINKLVLYAPILCGIGEYEVTEPFHHNDWEHAADDFQKDENGNFDLTVTDPVVIEMFCSSCWHYDRESSPNGGRRDVCVDPSNLLIDLDRIEVETLVICGDKDPYLNYDLVDKSIEHLPEGSRLDKIKGGSHVVYIEEPYYKEFQSNLLTFLSQGDGVAGS
ncbi:MAG: alpha/beta hydrolase [Lachnospiraceae bacterium]|nr:alpha/beta hydrolase [Lachnospiraceae bacterium]